MVKYLMIFLLIPSILWAAPFLVCDVDPIATSYIIEWLDGTETETPAPLHYNLNDVSVGEHPLNVRAKNMWGVSDPVPFTFTKVLPQSPINTRLETE